MHPYQAGEHVQSRAPNAANPSTRGQAMVEFALVLPIMLMMFIAIADFGRIFAAMIALEVGDPRRSRGGGQPVPRQPARRELIDTTGAGREPPTTTPCTAPPRRVVCADLRGLPNTNFDAGTNTCPDMPLVMVCVHDSQDTGCGSLASPVADAPRPKCTASAPRPTTARAAAATRGPLGRGPNLLPVHSHPATCRCSRSVTSGSSGRTTSRSRATSLSGPTNAVTPVSRGRVAATPIDGRGPSAGRVRPRLPLFLLVLFSVISFGLYIFYNQQLANAAREAARYAAVHSSTAAMPDGVAGSIRRRRLRPSNDTYTRCDAPEGGWPKDDRGGPLEGLGHGTATRSRWRPAGRATSTPANNYDALPEPPECRSRIARSTGSIRRTDPGGPRMSGAARRSRPRSHPIEGRRRRQGERSCSCDRHGSQPIRRTVTVYACFNWKPPMAGFVLIPSTITIRAVVTEAMQRQQ